MDAKFFAVVFGAAALGAATMGRRSMTVGGNNAGKVAGASSGKSATAGKGDGAAAPRSGAAIVSGKGAVSPAPSPASSSVSRDVDILARTIYGEARSEDGTGKKLVAATVLNRMRDARWPSTAAAVCQQNNGVTWQFDCWRPNTPNYRAMMAATTASASFAECLQIARQALSGALSVDHRGANLYYAPAGVIAAPWWASAPGVVHVLDHGGHKFYRE